jgi:hypothetical protein
LSAYCFGSVLEAMTKTSSKLICTSPVAGYQSVLVT